MQLFSCLKRVLGMPKKAIVAFLNSERRLWFFFIPWGRTYYLIRIHHGAAGIGAIIKSVLQHVNYAVSRGWVPVVDMKSVECQYHRPGEVGVVNIWERFFMQPGGVSLDDVPRWGNVILSTVKVAPAKEWFISVDLLLPENRGRLMEIAQSYSKYIRFVPEVREMIASYSAGFQAKIGVLCRGTDYLLRRPPGHPVQPMPEMVIRKVRELAKPFQMIFLATEDQEIWNLFHAEFKNRLESVTQRFRELGKNRFLSEIKKTEYDYYVGPIKYLASLNVIANCECFIAGRTSGTLIAYFMARRTYKNEYFFNLGEYPRLDEG